MEKEGSVCLVLYDLDVKKKTFYGCAKVEIHLIHVEVLHVELGCFHLGPGAMFTKEWLHAFQKASVMKQIPNN